LIAYRGPKKLGQQTGITIGNPKNAYLQSCERNPEPRRTMETTPVKPKKLNVKGILFDLDGTIVDSKEAYLEAAKTAFESMGQKPPEKKVALEIPKRLEQGLLIDDLVGIETRRFLDVYLKEYSSAPKTRTKPVPNIQPTLNALSKRVKLALITMRYVPKNTVTEELEQFGLAKCFTHILTALDTLKPKPSPEALIKAITAMDVSMCDCVIVGDSVTDIQAGKSAGAMTVAVLSGLFSRKELANKHPDLILKNATELPPFLHFAN
jgi:phosphoglycolate phosphatase/pyrophosphatase PpaX